MAMTEVMQGHAVQVGEDFLAATPHLAREQVWASFVDLGAMGHKLLYMFEEETAAIESALEALQDLAT